MPMLMQRGSYARSKSHVSSASSFLGRRPSRKAFKISSCIITTNAIIRVKAISCCFLAPYSPTPRLTGPFVVSSDSAVCSSTIIERRHEHRTAADPVAGLLRRGIALPRVGSSEAHRGRALVVVAGSASLLGDIGPQHLIYNG